jgi:hypothetical protein
MADETEIGSAGASDGGRYPPGGGEFDSPLQARAAFLKNWGWQSVISINRGACARGGALHGINSETGAACAAEWQARHVQALTFGETLDLLRSFHRKAPFLFLNGNTFANIGRELTIALTADLSAGRKREFMSAVGHYIAGVLDREPMVQIIEALCESASFQPGDRVKTMRGSLRGKILRLMDDGRVVWQPDDTAAELIAMPESLVREAK